MQYKINNNNFNLDNVDLTNRIPMEHYLVYNLIGAHGNIGRMTIYASVEIYQVDKNIYQRDFYIKVQSILWNNYKLYNGQCCSKNMFEPCVISCHYFFKFYISEEEVELHTTFLKSDIKENRLYIYAVTTHNVPTKKYNILVEVIDLYTEEIIDIGNIDAGQYSTAEANRGINLKGKFDNVGLTVSFGYVCRRYTSQFWINKCLAIPKIQYCDYETGDRNCINGATDIYCEINKAVLCNEDICNRNGICKILPNKIYCKCKEGYMGKYCEKMNCPNDCNGNGYCVNPTTCVCKSKYMGKLCEEYPCSENKVNLCENG
ncbi:hypothetical protein HZS_7941, partial [Henneguya salminicola]